ncbi:cyclin-I2 isoform X2 [Kogia breviceps]|uniref:cyclin-I2 isoform X2 n=1 Tax=Kogia breviceps TaxID=27615 RepID=UPI0034D20C8C
MSLSPLRSGEVSRRLACTERSVSRSRRGPDQCGGQCGLGQPRAPPPAPLWGHRPRRPQFPAGPGWCRATGEASWTSASWTPTWPRPRAARRACGWGADSRYRFPRGPLPRACSSSSSRAHGTRPGSTCTRDQQVEICEAFQEVVLGLLRVENIFDFSQTTFNLALTIFSRLIVSVKIKKCLLHCVTITSLRLAAKVNEEEELIPRIKDFIKHYGSGYSPNELLRMELAILDKLHWDLYSGTPLDFLTIVSTSLPWTRCAFRTAVHNIGWQSTRPCICSTVR